jgi:hypothetical protein
MAEIYYDNNTSFTLADIDSINNLECNLEGNCVMESREKQSNRVVYCDVYPKYCRDSSYFISCIFPEEKKIVKI